jgi:hypothetical protein
MIDNGWRNQLMGVTLLDPTDYASGIEGHPEYETSMVGAVINILKAGVGVYVVDGDQDYIDTSIFNPALNADLKAFETDGLFQERYLYLPMPGVAHMDLALKPYVWIDGMLAFFLGGSWQ